ncbi:MAG: hypothetical protein H7Y01_13785, partial [Ferruginibacter sp.]|nr:hypothetical protein [Chitinophagaceae bacterium]
MKYITSFLFLFCFQRTFSQEIKVVMEYGFAIGEMKAFKKIMLHSGVRAGMEFTIRRDLSLVISAGGSLLRFSYTTPASESVFNRKYFLTMPVSVKKYYPLSRKSGGFLEVGGYFNYLVSDKKEI